MYLAVNIKNRMVIMKQEELVEAIVNEVKRVLALRGIQVQAGKSASSATQASVPAAAPVSVESGARDLTGMRVITQKDLEGLSGATVAIAKKAVVTPLAYDYAREKGITLKKVEAPSGQNLQASVSTAQIGSIALTVAPDFPGDSMVVKKFLSSRGFIVKEITGRKYEEAVKVLADSISRGQADLGVCIEKSGMEGPIFANRNSKVRAVHCRDTFDARAARVDIGANIVVLSAASNPEAVISGFTGI